MLEVCRGAGIPVGRNGGRAAKPRRVNSEDGKIIIQLQFLKTLLRIAKHHPDLIMCHKQPWVAIALLGVSVRNAMVDVLSVTPTSDPVP